jgi:hypothetical protein
MGALYLLGDEMSNPIEQFINTYAKYSPNQTDFRQSLDDAISYARNNNHELKMNLRDYFAAKAMQSIIGLCYKEFDVDKAKKDVSQDAYEIADAMMKAREQ